VQLSKALDRGAVGDLPSGSTVPAPVRSSVKHAGAIPDQVLLREASNPTTLYPYVLVQERTPHLFQGAGLSRFVPGMRSIAPEDTLVVNPADAARIGLGDGDSVCVESQGDGTKTFPVTLRKNVAPGFLYLAATSKDLTFSTNPCPVSLRRSSV
jgi:anaerobic selenocysteine-containing dehydrogenase